MPTKSDIATAFLTLTATALVAAPSPADAASGLYRSCTALHSRWPHGVGRANAQDATSGTPVTNFFHSTRQYRIAIRKNRGLDRDHDGIACEAS